MGIKFFCPNGHKIHVKSFLAGKRGICPDCGVSVTIPTPSSSEDEDNEGNALPPPPVAGGATAKAASGAPPVVAAAPAVVRPAAVAVVPAPIAPAMAQPVAVAAPVAPRAAAAAQPAVPVAGMPAPMPMPVAVPAAPAVKVVPVAMGAPLPGMPVPPPPPAPPIAPGGDPIAQAPLAVWYVRPKGGEQFGPARGEIMRRWLGEGRVPADSLVWREGWDDWKPAGETFPSLLGGPAVAFGAAAAPAGSAPGSKKSLDRVAARRKSQNTMAWASIIILGLITTVMLGVLVYVLTR